MKRLFATLGILLLASVASAADETPSQVKNILFIISDDLKASVLGCYGHQMCQTPNIDKLAARGMLFERAYCQGMMCAPSRPSFMRSRYDGQKVNTVTLGEHLRQHDMHTARVGKVFHMPVPHAQLDGTDGVDVPACWTERHNTKTAETFTPGLYRQLNSDLVTRKIEGRDARGANRIWATVEADSDGSDQADYQVADKAIELLQQRKKAGTPFFLAVGFVRPHFPMVAPKKHFDMYDYEQIKLPAGEDGKTPSGLAGSLAAQQRMWQAYFASVTFLDDQVGRVVDELERLGLRESTAIVFTSDHGYHLGEHGKWKKNDLHEEVARVPLIVSVPGVEPGRTNAFAELVDFFPTCTDLLELPTPPGLHGQSLQPVLHDPTKNLRNASLSLLGSKYGLRSAKWAYMGTTKKGILYDMEKDPGQFNNVASDPKYADTLKEAQTELAARLAEFKK